MNVVTYALTYTGEYGNLHTLYTNKRGNLCIQMNVVTYTLTQINVAKVTQPIHTDKYK